VNEVSSEKEICPNCKRGIEPIISDGMTFMTYPERPYKRAIKLLGCPECKIIFYKE
jgi:uncharacterized protein with PIN domain